ncbi:TIGR02234 family membrane protein [Corynebacterium lowii]|uniref:Tryptophan-associated transmembrane protein n=1 Tax=Corynebacterium lowii TaxID=1544413 RepID=A0A0Q0YIW9_9CORY|nr:TIGR02234 family membrane protein [Corynebacterium lowii]KQB86700.1 Tryptophan-associated transmembrane protein [Corynebacterium lowii]MDP9851386.1 putative membrane protein (TIGR02234 family) [Corynebacterium lowii]
MNRRVGRIAALGLAVAAALQWASSRMTWIAVEAFDDKSGSTTASVSGSTWSTELVAVALLLAAGCVAGLALRRTGRRVVGIVCALAGAGLAWIPTQILMQGADTQRVHSLLSAGADTTGGSTAMGTQEGAVSLSQWAEISTATVQYAGPVLSIVGAALAVLGGVVLALRPGEDTATMNRYERKESREQRLRADLHDAPDSGRVLWDALDADIDPTDTADTTDTRGAAEDEGRR